MNCEVCGTELPHGAMFCGECGRAVGTRAVQAVHPDSGMPITETATNGSAPMVAGSRDTAIIEPLTQQLPEFEAEIPSGVAPDSQNEVPPVTNDIPALFGSQEQVEQDLPPEVVAAEQRADSQGADSAGPSWAPVPPRASAQRPDPFPWGDRGSAIFIDSDEIEQTLIVPRRESGERFILQFSTGESVTVFGSGLLGRNPMAQPSEYFDQLVRISDPGKSVSKTHLEFGQEAGSFWVSDRYSGNGSVVREPESPPRRLRRGQALPCGARHARRYRRAVLRHQLAPAC